MAAFVAVPGARGGARGGAWAWSKIDAPSL